MTNEGLFRIINMRITECQQRIDELYDCNTLSPFPGSQETTNPSANATIYRIKHEEIPFLKELLKHALT